MSGLLRFAYILVNLCLCWDPFILKRNLFFLCFPHSPNSSTGDLQCLLYKLRSYLARSLVCDLSSGQKNLQWQPGTKSSSEVKERAAVKIQCQELVFMNCVEGMYSCDFILSTLIFYKHFLLSSYRIMNTLGIKKSNIRTQQSQCSEGDSGFK